ncbi:MAG: hypothetical protein IJ452_07310 [Butyricicoccus sp.]|nr:hypothetical protein [Butyricicoccus sp.]
MPTVCFFKKTFLKNSFFIQSALTGSVGFVQFHNRWLLDELCRNPYFFGGVQKQFCTPIFMHILLIQPILSFLSVIPHKRALFLFMSFLWDAKNRKNMGAKKFALFCTRDPFTRISAKCQKAAVLAHRGSEEHLIQSAGCRALIDRISRCIYNMAMDCVGGISLGVTG